ncbi:trimeric LpxA-like protein [Dactylonectria macrodidyma]|uniref:Trimeric LpxA-like protein n=1 Tax=Dactylonectria macrodidyma TaxID=307937 RepID=A0A9P9IG01_9HYPO|nr:trimeric LpxA-like protein [Dactylonectria macrodidyma]
MPLITTVVCALATPTSHHQPHRTNYSADTISDHIAHPSRRRLSATPSAVKKAVQSSDQLLAHLIAMDFATIDKDENKRRMRNGEMYYALTDDLVRDRQRCQKAMKRFNASDTTDRRALVEMWKDIISDSSDLPPPAATPEQEEAQLQDWPWVESPLRTDYGYNIKIGARVFINANSTWIDTCTITVGARTLIGPNCSFFSGSHPLDPTVRNGMLGPESGKPIVVGEDCWFGGNCIVLPGVTIGRGVTVGAGSVVTKDVPDRVVVAGNPAKIIRRLDEGEALR